MSRPRTLAAKLLSLGVALLLLAVISVGVTLWISLRLEGGAAAVNEAGRLRMQAWRLAAQVSAGESALVQDLGGQFELSLALLRDGDSRRPLAVPWDDTAQRRFDAVVTHWHQLKPVWLGTAPPLPAQASQRAVAIVTDIDAFVAAVEHALARWTAILSLAQMGLMVLAIGAALLLMLAGQALVLSPLARLGEGLARVEEGDLSTRVAVGTLDEFGQLAQGFNRMAQTLETLYGGLEHKVREKTAHLETQRQRLARLYEMSEFLARATSLDDMARGFVRQIRGIAGADAAALRWSDDASQRYVLLAGDCLPQALVDGEHCVTPGECHCGQPQAAPSTRVVPIRATGGAGENHCTRAGFASLVSVPVTLQQRLLGEIDLLFRDNKTLDAGELQHLNALASHLASAVEGLRAEALERESAVAEERGLLARELHDSIAQSLAFLNIQVGLLRDAHQRADAPRITRTIDELDAGVRESTADVRELLVHFRTRTNAEDILPALRTTLQKFEHQTGLRSHLEVHGAGLPLPPDVQIQVLHVVQEALSNVRKHAAASAVWLEVQQGPQWSVEVRDDGRGFDPADDSRGEMHVGLRIMRERAERIGATVSLDSVPGAGTCVTLTLPARQEALAA